VEKAWKHVDGSPPDERALIEQNFHQTAWAYGVLLRDIAG
jgi:hypothetical protein